MYPIPGWDSAERGLGQSHRLHGSVEFIDVNVGGSRGERCCPSMKLVSVGGVCATRRISSMSGTRHWLYQDVGEPLGRSNGRRPIHCEKAAPEKTRGLAERPHGAIKRRGLHPSGKPRPVSRPCTMGPCVAAMARIHRCAAVVYDAFATIKDETGAPDFPRFRSGPARSGWGDRQPPPQRPR